MRVAIVLATLLTAASAHAQTTEHFIETPQVSLVGASGSTKVAVAISTVVGKTADVVPDAEPGQFPPELRVVKALSIQVNGKPILVPRSAYVDLVWVRSARLTVRARGGELLIRGGDASESYSMKLTFDWSRVRTRAVYSPLAPATPLEESRYHGVAMQ